MKQQRAEYDRARRDDPFRAIYQTAQWRYRTRPFILARDPLCKIAKVCVERYGVAMPSTNVDHIEKLRAGVDPFDPANLQGACHACHSWKTSQGG